MRRDPGLRSRSAFALPGAWLYDHWVSAAYLWELCDALGTERWRRRVTRDTPREPARPGGMPFVSLHVPAHNEPPEMVIQTLTSLLHLDYPSYEFVVIDDNTDDEQLWRPVADWCTEHGVTFFHLADWPGYKSGALNVALREYTDPRAELVGVVDSDYQLAPDFLRRCAPLFADDRIGFIQAPQDYRDWGQAPYYRRLYYSYEYFFAISQPSRNERDGAIFAGTMGLIRRPALEAVGGWDEWCITEDAELSLRLLRAGWSGLHVDDSFGRGVMPLTFEALKSQRYRWCFGGIQILRMHWRSMFPRRRRRRGGRNPHRPRHRRRRPAARARSGAGRAAAPHRAGPRHAGTGGADLQPLHQSQPRAATTGTSPAPTSSASSSATESPPSSPTESAVTSPTPSPEVTSATATP